MPARTHLVVFRILIGWWVLACIDINVRKSISDVTRISGDAWFGFTVPDCTFHIKSFEVLKNIKWLIENCLFCFLSCSRYCTCLIPQLLHVNCAAHLCNLHCPAPDFSAMSLKTWIAQSWTGFGSSQAFILTTASPISAPSRGSSSMTPNSDTLISCFFGSSLKTVLLTDSYMTSTR